MRAVIEVVVVLEFHVDPSVPYSKNWKRLDGSTLERHLSVPEVMLAAGNYLELPLDGVTRDIKIDYLCWRVPNGLLAVHTVPGEDLAEELRALGLRAWRPWIGRRAAEEFLQRCATEGWSVHRESASSHQPPANREASRARREPTL